MRNKVIEQPVGVGALRRERRQARFEGSPVFVHGVNLHAHRDRGHTHADAGHGRCEERVKRERDGGRREGEECDAGLRRVMQKLVDDLSGPGGREGVGAPAWRRAARCRKEETRPSRRRCRGCRQRPRGAEPSWMGTAKRGGRSVQESRLRRS